MPALSLHFNLHPPVVWQLTDEELQPYLDALERLSER